MQNPDVGQQDKRQVFDEIQAFTRSLVGSSGLSLSVPPETDRIIVTENGISLYLESYGTGVHHLVLLCSVLAMHKNKIICIEEPEIHLHPDLQRKFLNFIATKTDNIYFISTHSNAFLDIRPDVNLYHVRQEGGRTLVEPVTADSKAREILTDMGYKASDLLQANGIIWVEGPSDRVYINKWLELLAPSEFVEGVHYSFAFYGGKVLAHFSATDDPVDDLVEVLRINRHAMVVMDRDGDDETVKLTASKERIQKELEPDACWVTKGREIENYLPKELVEQFLKRLYGREMLIKFGRNSRLDRSIKTAIQAEKQAKVQYAREKVRFAREFCNLMTRADLDVLDLKDRISRVIARIREWNHVEPVKTGSS